VLCHLTSVQHLANKSVTQSIVKYLIIYHRKMRDGLTKLNWQVQSKKPFEFGRAIGLIQSIRFNSYLYAKRSQETFGDCCRPTSVIQPTVSMKTMTLC